MPILHETPSAFQLAGQTPKIASSHNAPEHRARDTVKLLQCETPQFIRPDM